MHAQEVRIKAPVFNWNWFNGLVQRYQMRQQRKHDFKELLSLDEKVLKDVGLTRGDIYHEYRDVV